jgi:predicted AAA+ superfamily ATPase
MKINRTIAAAVGRAVQQYPIVAITGPRQSGKTTLVKDLFPDRPYILLEEPDRRRFATEDPRGFLASFPDGAVLDEAHRAPELFSYLQGIVDNDPRPGRFILTGSQQFGLLSGITQSLAGRAAMMILLPFSVSELSQGTPPDRLEDLLFQGLYPPIHDRGLYPSEWYSDYMVTYVERDVRQLVNVRDLGAFEMFLRLCAGRCGQLVNLSGLAADCGITHNTARSWLSVLEASYIIATLQPHHRNFSKRIIKSPKLYFLDPGLAAWLLDIRNPNQLVGHSKRGALFETWIYSELLKYTFNRRSHHTYYFWRDRSGLEIDFVIDRAGTLMPIEAKSGKTSAGDWAEPIERWRMLAGEESGQGWIIYGGEESRSFKGIDILAWRDIDRLFRAIE